MSARLSSELRNYLLPFLCDDATQARFRRRLMEGRLTRDENPVSHVCTFFAPYDPDTHRVFLIHHRKSGLWIFPGGHVDAGETLMETVEREMGEELGLPDPDADELRAFFLSVITIENPGLACREHLDVWFCFPSDGKDFAIFDHGEFLDHRWVSFNQARDLATDPLMLQGLDRLERFLKIRI